MASGPKKAGETSARVARTGVEAGEVAPEAVGDDVLEAVIGPLEPLAVAAGLAAGELSFAQGAEVLLEARQAIGAQGGGAVDVLEAPG